MTEEIATALLVWVFIAVLLGFWARGDNLKCPQSQPVVYDDQVAFDKLMRETADHINTPPRMVKK